MNRWQRFLSFQLSLLILLISIIPWAQATPPPPPPPPPGTPISVQKPVTTSQGTDPGNPNLKNKKKTNPLQNQQNTVKQKTKKNTPPPAHPDALTEIPLDLDKIFEFIPTFHVTIEGPQAQDSTANRRSKHRGSRAVMYGTVYKDCLQYLIIRPHSKPTPKNFACPNAVGFEILEGNQRNGMNFEKCVKANDCLKVHCVNLTSLPNTSIELPIDGEEVEVKVMSVVPNEDELSKNRFKCEDVADAPLKHKPENVIQAEAERAREEEVATQQQEEEKAQVEKNRELEESREKTKRAHQEKIAQFLSDKNCADCNEGVHIDKALAANTALLNMAAIEQHEHDENVKDIQQKHLQLLIQEATKIPLNPRNLGVLEDKLDAIEDANAEDKKGLVKIFDKIANEYLRKPRPDPLSFEFAMTIINRAIDLADNQRLKEDLSIQLEELKFERVKAIAQRGRQNNPYSFDEEWSQLYKETREVWEDLCHGRNHDERECRGATKRLKDVMSLPSHAQMADQNSMQSQMQLHQTLNAMNPNQQQHPGMFPPNQQMPYMNPQMQQQQFLQQQFLYQQNPMYNQYSPTNTLNPYNPMAMSYLNNPMATMANYNPLSPMNPYANQMNQPWMNPQMQQLQQQQMQQQMMLQQQMMMNQMNPMYHMQPQMVPTYH